MSCVSNSSRWATSTFADFDFYDPTNGKVPKGADFMLNVFEDSVAPVHQAGLLTLWEDEYVIDSGLRIDPAPGHPPGSSAITLGSGTDRAVFVGDLLHNPLQLQEPDCCPMLDEDPARATVARRRVLGWASDNNAFRSTHENTVGLVFQVRPVISPG